MASYDAKSLNPRKWIREEQQLFSPPLGFTVVLCMTVEVPTSKSRFKMTTSRLKRGRVQRNNSPSKSQEEVGFSARFM